MTLMRVKKKKIYKIIKRGGERKSRISWIKRMEKKKSYLLNREQGIEKVITFHQIRIDEVKKKLSCDKEYWKFIYIFV